MPIPLKFSAGMVAGSALTLAVLTAGGELAQARRLPSTADGEATTSGRAAATQAPSKAAVKYSTQVVFENERVRVKDVTFPPGVLDTGMHTHDLAHVGVILTDGRLVFTDENGKKETASFTSGSVGFRGPNATHMVANPGSRPMRVIEVEVK